MIRRIYIFHFVEKKRRESLLSAKSLDERDQIRDEEVLACTLARSIVETVEALEFFNQWILLLWYEHDLEQVEESYFVERKGVGGGA